MKASILHWTFQACQKLYDNSQIKHEQKTITLVASHGLVQVHDLNKHEQMHECSSLEERQDQQTNEVHTQNSQQLETDSKHNGSHSADREEILMQDSRSE
jgi:hypothetical protein